MRVLKFLKNSTTMLRPTKTFASKLPPHRLILPPNSEQITSFYKSLGLQNDSTQKITPESYEIKRYLSKNHTSPYPGKIKKFYYDFHVQEIGKNKNVAKLLKKSKNYSDDEFKKLTGYEKNFIEETKMTYEQCCGMLSEMIGPNNFRLICDFKNEDYYGKQFFSMKPRDYVHLNIPDLDPFIYLCLFTPESKRDLHENESDFRHKARKTNQKILLHQKNQKSTQNPTRNQGRTKRTPTYPRSPTKKQ